MAKCKRRKFNKSLKDLLLQNRKEISIWNLPKNCLQMKVKNGTKMRNILQYALKHFSNHCSIVWSAVAEGITKVISCAEFFKRHHPGLNQAIKLRYIKSQRNNIQTNQSTISYMPEIHIILSKNPICIDNKDKRIS